MSPLYRELAERFRGENVYTTNLQPERMAGLLRTLPELWPRLRAALLAFAEFLTYLAGQT
jgi:hypothetical protein